MVFSNYNNTTYLPFNGPDLSKKAIYMSFFHHLSSIDHPICFFLQKRKWSTFQVLLIMPNKQVRNFLLEKDAKIALHSYKILHALKGNPGSHSTSQHFAGGDCFASIKELLHV